MLKAQTSSLTERIKISSWGSLVHLVFELRFSTSVSFIVWFDYLKFHDQSSAANLFSQKPLKFFFFPISLIVSTSFGVNLNFPTFW